MGESLWVDIDAMRAASSELNRAAGRTAAMVAELEAELARTGEFWGDDEPGELFAESYVPGVDQAMEGMRNLVAALRATGHRFAAAADDYSGTDTAGATHLGTPDTPVRAGEHGISLPGTRTNPLSYAAPEYHSVPSGYPPLPVPAHPSSFQPPADKEPRTGATPYSPARPARSPEPEPEPEAASPPSRPLPPDEPTGSDAPGPDRPGNGEPVPPRAPTDAVGRATATTPPVDTPPVDGPAPHPAAKAVDGTRVNPVSAGQPGPPAGRPAGTSAPEKHPNSPWSKSTDSRTPTSSSATAPQHDPPPRTAPPRTAAPRTPGEKGAAGKPARDTVPARPLVRRPQASELEAMRIAREMAARHDLEIRGFEAAGLHPHTVREMAAALDTVLGRYTLPLCGIEIAHLTGVLSRAEHRDTAGGSGSPGHWIVLDSAATANPPVPAASARATETVHHQRPVYAMTARALGGVLDISGGYRARREAQRALITEYLRVRGSKGDTLARVVGGYKRWRSELSDSCFHHGVFAPAPALAEAFATVEAAGEAAGPPQKVLHRLLVTLARTTGADT